MFNFISAQSSHTVKHDSKLLTIALFEALRTVFFEHTAVLPSFEVLSLDISKGQICLPYAVAIGDRYPNTVGLPYTACFVDTSCYVPMCVRGHASGRWSDSELFIQNEEGVWTLDSALIVDDDMTTLFPRAEVLSDLITIINDDYIDKRQERIRYYADWINRLRIEYKGGANNVMEGALDFLGQYFSQLVADADHAES